MANRKKGEAVTNFIFLGSKITADGDCSHEIKKKKKKKPMPAPWKESYDKLRQHIRNQRHHFGNKAMVLPVDMYGYESWTIKQVEH